MYKSVSTKSARVSLCTCIIPLIIIRLDRFGGNLLTFLSSHLLSSWCAGSLVNPKVDAHLHWRLIRSLSYMNFIGSMEMRMHAGSESVSVRINVALNLR